MILHERMKKSPLYIVTTNYNWPASITQYNEKSVLAYRRAKGVSHLDILGRQRQFDQYNGQELEARLKKERGESMFPCLTIRHDLVTVYTRNSRHENTVGKSFSWPGSIDYHNLRKIVLIEDESLKESHLRAYLPKEFSYFDLIFNFVSNEGRYDDLFEQLADDFSLRYLVIKRPKTGTAGRMPRK